MSNKSASSVSVDCFCRASSNIVSPVRKSGPDPLGMCPGSGCGISAQPRQFPRRHPKCGCGMRVLVLVRVSRSRLSLSLSLAVCVI